MKRRFFAMLLSLAMLFTLAPTAFATESESQSTAMSGNCGADDSGDSVKWALTDDDEDGSYTLTISGNGAMANLNKSTETKNISDGAGTYPWANLKDSITKIVIEDGVTSIGSKAFIAYTNVTSVSIGKDVSEIGVGALSQLSACSKFNVSSQNDNFMTDKTGALFDDSQTKLIAFPCGSSVEEYAIPTTVTVISYGAFSRAAHLKTITIPADSLLSTIGYGAFAFTTALETVDLIPASAKTIGDIPFAQSGVKHIYCANADTRDRIQGKVNGMLVDVLLPNETPAIEVTDNGYTYRIDDGKALLVSAPKDVAKPTVPSEVTYEKTKYPVTGIWKGAFAISLDWTEANSSADKRNETITSVVLPDSVTQIGERAFYFCKNLSTITIQANTVSIDKLAFATQNTSGTTVDFSAVTTLQSNGTDKWAGVKEVILNKENQLDAIKSNVKPNTVAVIGSNKWVMGSDGNWTEQPKTNLTAKVGDITWTFDAVGGKATLTAYSPKTVESVTVPSTLTADGVTYTVTELGEGLFGWTGDYTKHDKYNKNIRNVVIPKTVTTIGADMFRYSQNLESVTIQGESVLFKKGRTFSGTNSLKVLDMSAVKAITFNSDNDTNSDKDTSYFSNMGSNNKSPAVIYVSSSAIMSAVEAHRSSGYLTYAVTNGGTLKNPPTSNIELATPVKDGYIFDGWYADSRFSGTAVTAPTAGQTYYAKWKEKTEQTAPAVPTLKDRTYTSITLNTIEGAQYRCNDGAWQTTPEFTGLTAGTTYTFEAYYPETADCKASPTSGKVEFSTLRHSSGSSSNPTYSVTTPSKSENGGVAVSSKNARKGDTVTVTVTPDAGYQLDKLTVTDKNGNVLKLTDKGDGKYSFTMPDGKVEIKAVFAKKVETSPFDDVSADAYYNQAVQWAQEKGITDGISSNLFGPKQPCTRSQIVTFLWRAAGSPEPKGTAAGMTDVAPGSYYAKAVAWAVENGITTGTAEGTFSPDATCTRAQAVTFLARAQNAKATGKTAFSDVPADSYFADAVAWAQANGVTTGTSETTFSPDNDCTRAQIVTFLYRANQGT